MGKLTKFGIFKQGLKGASGLYTSMLILIVIGNVIGALLPYFFKNLIDQSISKSSLPSSLTFGIFCLIVFVREGAYRLGHYFEVLIARKQIKNIYRFYYDVLDSKPLSFFESKTSGMLAKRLNYISESTMFFVAHFPWHIAWVGIDLTLALILFAVTDSTLLLAFGLWLVFFAGLSVPLLWLQSGASVRLSSRHSDFNGFFNDQITGKPIAYYMGAKQIESERFSNELDDLISFETKDRYINLLNKAHQGLSVVLLWVIMAYAALRQYNNGSITVGDLVLVAGLVPMLTAAVWSIGDMILLAIKHQSDLQSATDFLNKNSEVINYGHKAITPNTALDITFDRVSFTYPEVKKSVFKDLSLTIPHKKHIGLVGISGTGKTTFLKLLLRVVEQDRGTISVGGVDIRDLTPEAFHSLFSVVSQDTYLYHRSIYDNICIAKPNASAKEVEDACKSANLSELIASLNDGFNTMVGERGVKLSGGQRQRVAIARAILKNSPILILDEATSSLDSESEKLIQDALHEAMKNKTVIAIAHRLSTLKDMNEIIVMSEGMIVDKGSVDELLSRQGVFKSLWSRQHDGYMP